MKDRIISYSLKFIQLQLTLTLFSLPLLIMWGLPISLLSPIGNLVFSPVLTAFLLLSSLIFFSELLRIPNGWLIWLLEQLTHYWIKAMDINPSPWLVGFTKPHPLFLIAIPAATLGILLNTHTREIKRSILCLSTLFLLTWSYLSFIETPTHLVDRIACNKHHVTLTKDNNAITVIDPGVIGQRASTWSWLEYTLLPELVKKTGATHIDHVILLQPTSRTLDGITKLCRTITIGTIYSATSTDSSEPVYLEAYKKLEKAAQTSNTHVIALHDQTIKIPLNKGSLQLTPLNATIKTSHGIFTAYKVMAYNPAGNCTIYPRHYKKIDRSNTNPI